MQHEHRAYLQDYQTRLIEYVNSKELKAKDRKNTCDPPSQKIIDEIKRIERYINYKPC